MAIKFVGDHISILFDPKCPITFKPHPEWNKQFISAINSKKTHKILDKKLSKFAPLVLYYTKIMPETMPIVFDRQTVCILSSVGEHKTTPWMIIHNIGHTIVSNNLWIKREILSTLGLEKHWSIVTDQAYLVCSAASRNGTIPNINELIYELFTTWVWYGDTKSNCDKLATKCNEIFNKAMSDMKEKVFYHKYRPPLYQLDQPLDLDLLCAQNFV